MDLQPILNGFILSSGSARSEAYFSNIKDPPFYIQEHSLLYPTLIGDSFVVSQDLAIDRFTSSFKDRKRAEWNDYEPAFAVSPCWSTCALCDI